MTIEKLSGEQSGTSEQSLARLLKLSGERGTPSAHATARAHAAASEAWQSALRERRSQRGRQLFLGFAAALAVALVGALAWKSLGIIDEPRTLAQIVQASGEGSLVSSDSETGLFTGALISEKAELRTREGRAALSIGDSLSLRVNVHSRVRFEAEHRITLLAGTIYVDSGGLSAQSDLRIVTPAGEVQHQGTQYQIAVTGDLTQIRVREGRVRLSGRSDSDPIHVSAGEEIRIDTEGSISRRAVSSFGPEWEWASMLAVPIDIENRPLIEFLAWMVREHGWQLRYASSADEHAVHSIRLHGALPEATPEKKLQRVSLITGLPMYVHEGVLLVGSSRSTAQ